MVFGVFGSFTVFAQDSAADITEISTLAELEAFRDDVNSGNTYEGKTVKLTADIDMSEKYGEGKENWTPISNSYDKAFSGTFDGNNHTINNLYINITEYAGVDDYGLFGFIDGTLKNLNVNGSVICYSDRVAGVVVSVGENGAVIDCSFDGAVKGNSFVGGIAVLVQGFISGCHCSGTVEGLHMVGGIVSNVSYGLERDGIVENCINESAVTAGSLAGGIVGVLNIYATVRSCVNKGEVKGVVSEYEDAQMIGGIAGSNENSIIENCYNTGLVSGKQKIGGITGKSEGPYSDSYTNKLAVKNCYNIGNVTAISEETAENRGSIIGESISDNGDIANNYYLDTCISDAQATALTTEQFADKTNFNNWDFETVWEMDATLGRPVLRLNTEEPPTQTHTHTLVHHAAVAATCTENGTGEYWKCEGTDACNKMFSDANGTTEIAEIPTIIATGHTEVTDIAIEPTCETDGKTASSHCSVCNTVITEQTIIPKLNHNWGAWSITTEPTFDVTGKAERICGNDNTHKEIVDLPILTDTNVWMEDLKIEPTETEKGSVTYTSQYGNVTIIIPALNPEYDYSIKYENGKAVVTVKQDDTYAVIFAAYDNGRLLSVSVQDIQLVKGENLPISPQNFNANGKVKVMLWDSLKGMKPLCRADGN